jgi:signal transduction histidine kinase
LKDVGAEEIHQSTVRHNELIFENLSYPIALNKGEQPTNIVNHYVDVTLSHNLQKQMIQNEKMAAIGHLAGHIAHELNNPLTGIRSLSQVILPQLDKATNTYKDLLEVEKAAERCQLIIKNLLEFSSGALSRQHVSLNEIVQRTLPLLKTAMSPFQHQLNLSDENVLVDVEPQLMQQVFFNLVKNACQAMDENGTLSIETRVSPVDDRAELVVSDTGSGMTPEIKQHIFDFFFTTKSQGQGTGLGLSMSKSIVDQFGGEIDVESKLGEGSRFSVRLPRVKESQA